MISKPLARNVGLALGAAAVTLVAAEAVLRVVPGALPEEVALRMHWTEIREMEPVTSGDPVLGFRYPANAEIHVRRGDTRFLYHTDAHGFRNASPWPETADVVVVGDSQVFGWGVADDEVWVHLLDQALPETSVINLGLTGAAPKQYTRVLERFGLGLRPSLVVYTLFPGNDGADEELFNRWEAAGSPGNYDVWRFFRGSVPSRDLVSRIMGRSALVGLVRAARSGRPLSGSTMTFADGTRVRIAPGAYASAASKLLDGNPGRESALTSVESARELATDIGARFLVVLVPTKEEVYLPGLGQDPPQLSQALIGALAERGFEVLDLTPALRAADDGGTALFFEIDGHPNAAGHRAMARAVEHRLRTGHPGD